MKKLLLPFLVASACTQVQAQLVINEIMQSNIDLVMDDLNDFPDSWVELYNASPMTIDLAEFSLGIKKDPEKAWPLPSVLLAPGQHQLIYCDKVADGLHTSFRLESGKDGSVYLFRDGQVSDKLKDLKKQPAPNIAYGREQDGSGEWGYQAEPTPGEPNCGVLCNQILGNPVFSKTGRVLTGSQTLVLNIGLPEDAPEGTQIHYTTDGSEPTLQSPLFPQEGLSISQTSVIRAKLFCEGWLSPRSLTQSYIFFPRELTLPVFSLVTDQRYFFDPKLGIYVEGNYSSTQENFRYDWRRPVNVEFFTAEGQKSELNQLCETRVTGGQSRLSKLKSLAVYANKRFGEKRLDAELFPQQRPGQTDYKSIMLRNAGNDFDYLYMRDAIIQSNMAAHADLDYQAYRPAIFYLNGEYMGMLNMRERSNEDNIYTNYNGLEDIDMLENWNEVKTGSIDNYRAFHDFYSEEGHTWAEYQDKIDLVEFMNLMIMNLYYCNLDFPANNIIMWRPTEEGGRWRFVAKDTDFGLGLYGRSVDYNTLEWLYTPGYDPGNNWGNTEGSTRLFRHLMDDETFRREFVDRTAIYMGDFLNYEGTWAIWELMYNHIKYEYPYHRALFNKWWPNYNEELNNAKTWLSKRTDRFYTMLHDFYVSRYAPLGDALPLKINLGLSAEEREALTITFNKVKLSAGKFDGRFFQGRQISLQGQMPADSNLAVLGWNIRQIKGAEVKDSYIEGSACTFDMPECTQLQINAVIGDPSGIAEVRPDAKARPVAYYDIQGLRHDHPVKGQNLVLMSDGRVLKVQMAE